MRLSIGSVNGRVRAVGWGTVLAGVLVLGVPLHARAQSSGLPELEIVTKDSEDNTVADKGATAACAAGQTPIGGGAQVLGNVGHVFLQQSYGGKDSTWVGWAEALDQTNPWRVQARAMCVPVGLASDSGLEIVEAVSADNSVADKFAQAVCPSGKTVIGGGAQVLGNVGHVFLQGSYRENDTTWVGWAEAFDQTNPWRVFARAVCVSSGFAADRGLEVVTNESADDVVADKQAGAKCPAGKTAIGGGAQLLGNIGHVFLQKTAPGADNPGRGSQPDDDWGVWAESLKKDPWHVRAQVICVAAAAAPPTTSTTLPRVVPRGDERAGQGPSLARTGQGPALTPAAPEPAAALPRTGAGIGEELWAALGLLLAGSALRRRF